MTTDGFTLSITAGKLVCAEIGMAAPKHAKMTNATRKICRTQCADARRAVDPALRCVDRGIMRLPFVNTVPVPTIGAPLWTQLVTPEPGIAKL